MTIFPSHSEQFSAVEKTTSPKVVSSTLVQRSTHFIHQNFLVILISAYVMAGFLPQFGLWLRHIEFGQIRLTDGRGWIEDRDRERFSGYLQKGIEQARETL